MHIREWVVIAFAAVLFSLPFVFGMPQKVYESSRYDYTYELFDEMPYIVHAGGAIKPPKGSGDKKSYKYTNSREALEKTYQKGNRVVEMDFASTADGGLVCLHDWEEMTYTNDTDQSNAALNGQKLTMEQFRSVRIYGWFTPMTVDDMIEFMREHEDLVLISDTKSDDESSTVVDGRNDTDFFCDYIRRNAPELRDRIIIQIYQQGDYEDVKNAGFDHIIYTLYRLPDEDKLDTEAHRKFAAQHPLVGITFQKALLKNKGFMKGMKACHVPLFVHTVNGKKKAKTLNQGITAVYTDNARNEPVK